jgi:hypothetical protein
VADEARVTQVAGEVLSVDEDPTLRVTQVPLEVLSVDENPTLRTTQAALEVLSTLAASRPQWSGNRLGGWGGPRPPFGSFEGKSEADVTAGRVDLGPLLIAPGSMGARGG